VLDGDVAAFDSKLTRVVERLAADPELPDMLSRKRDRRFADEARKPLARYREEELTQMWQNFYGVDPTYHEARRRFVYKLPATETCSRIARHRAGSAGAPIVFDVSARR
jgi:putative two-component system hydrogenase maturation factor HypX/HoxX